MPTPKLPADQKRVPVFGRVAKPTKEFLETIPAPNDGRAIDSLVTCVETVKEVFEEVQRIPSRTPLKRPVDE
jgi:hypothetical protein